jgi:hypothetical protein
LRPSAGLLSVVDLRHGTVTNPMPLLTVSQGDLCYRSNTRSREVPLAEASDGLLSAPCMIPRAALE